MVAVPTGIEHASEIRKTWVSSAADERRRYGTGLPTLLRIGHSQSIRYRMCAGDEVCETAQDGEALRNSDGPDTGIGRLARRIRCPAGGYGGDGCLLEADLEPFGGSFLSCC